MGARPEIDILLRHHEEHLRQTRHHEDMRVHATSILVAIAGGVVALAGLDGLSVADVPSGLLVVVLAGLGVLLSLKHYERFKWHSTISDESVTLRSPNTIADEAIELHLASWTIVNEFRRTSRAADDTRAVSAIGRMRLFALWAMVPCAVGLVGLLVMVLGVAGVGP